MFFNIFVINLGSFSNCARTRLEHIQSNFCAKIGNLNKLNQSMWDIKYRHQCRRSCPGLKRHNCVSIPLKSVIEVNIFESQMEEISLTGRNIIDLSVSPGLVHKMELVTAGMVWRFQGKIPVWMKFAVKSNYMHCKLMSTVINIQRNHID